MKKEASYERVTAEASVTQLRKGGILLKFCRRAPPHFVNVRLSSDGKHIVYNRVGSKKKKQLSVLRIAGVEPGVTHRVFLGIFQYVPGRASKLQQHSITVAYFDKREYLRKFSVACSSNEEQQLWMRGLETVTALQQHANEHGDDEESHNHAAGWGLGLPGELNPRASFSLGLRSANGSQNDLVGSVDASQISFEMQRVLGLGHAGRGGAGDEPNNAEEDDRSGEPSSSSFSQHQHQNQHQQDFLARHSRQAARSLLPGDLFWWGAHRGGDAQQSAMAVAAEPRPTVLEGTGSLDVVAASFGADHGVLVTRSGGSYAWGGGSGGQLGHGGRHALGQPGRIRGGGLGSEATVACSCGAGNAAVVTAKGECFVWGGQGSQGQGAMASWVPKQVSSLSGRRVLSVSCGPYHGVLVTSEPRGNLYSWGDNFLGKLGLGEGVRSAAEPTRVEGGGMGRRTARHAACGTWHTAAAVALEPTSRSSSPGQQQGGEGAENTAEGSLFVWGQDERGCLGLGSREGGGDVVVWEPRAVTGLPCATDLCQVSCGQSHTLVLSDKGRVYQAGECGPLSLRGSFQEVSVQHETVSQIACGLHHCACVSSDRHRVYTWGRGKEGQLGHGDLKCQKDPKSVQTLAAKHVVDLQCGDHSTVCVCAHVDYDDVKVERQLRAARQKFQSVVGAPSGLGGSTSHSPEDKAKPRRQQDEHAEEKALGSGGRALGKRARGRSKSKSVIKMITTLMGAKTKRKSGLEGGGSAGGVPRTILERSSPEVAATGSKDQKKRAALNVDSTLDVMTKLGDGINKARSLSAHARDERANTAAAEALASLGITAAAAGTPSPGESPEADDRKRTSFLTIFKEEERKPNMERLAKRIVDLERQISLGQAQQQQQQQRGGGSGVDGEGKENAPLSQRPDRDRDRDRHGNQITPTHSRTSTWSFDLTNDQDGFARIRKQSQSMENIVTTPLAPAPKFPIQVPMTEIKRPRSDSLVHLSAQNQRLKQKLRDLERRLSERESAEAVDVAGGARVHIRQRGDRREVHKVTCGSAEQEQAFKAWVSGNRAAFLREHRITHVDVTGSGSVLDLLLSSS